MRKNRNYIVADNIRYYLAAQHKTQRDVANDLGIKQASLSNWCTGKVIPNIKTTQCLADYFGVDISELLESRGSRLEEILATTNGTTGDRIRIARKYRHLSMNDLAEKSGTTYEMVRRCETNPDVPISTDRLKAIAGALRVSVEALTKTEISVLDKKIIEGFRAANKGVQSVILQLLGIEEAG